MLLYVMQCALSERIEFPGVFNCNLANLLALRFFGVIQPKKLGILKQENHAKKWLHFTLS